MKLTHLILGLEPELLQSLSLIIISDEKMQAQARLVFLRFIPGEEKPSYSSPASPYTHPGEDGLSSAWKRFPEKIASLDISQPLEEQIEALYTINQLGQLNVVYWQASIVRSRSQGPQSAWVIQTHAATPVARNNWQRALARQQFISDEKMISGDHSRTGANC